MRSFVLAAACAIVPTATFAAPITLDFTGQVYAYAAADHSSTSTNLLGTLSTLDASGSFTFDPALGPTPVLTLFPGVVYEYTQKLPPTEFVSATVTWANGVFTSSPIPVPAGMTATQDEFAMSNNLGGNQDLMILGDLFGWEDPSNPLVYGLNGIALNSSSSFLDDASGFWDGITFPDFASSLNVLALFDFTQDAEGRGNGWAAGILIDSLTIRVPTAVPEPSSLLLLFAGLGGAAFVRRKNAARSRG